jgi:cytochrome c biogenesis protein CcmG/thiol:disulfide interchange protein DsbE
VAVLTGAGCGREGETVTVTAAAEKAEVLPVLRKAPEWVLKDVDGREVKAGDFKGKVVVVDFWATWCPPCRKEIPEYVALQEKYRERGLVILGFSMDEGPAAEVKAFGAQFKVNYPLVMADADTAEAFGGIEGLPTAFVIDRGGNIRHVKLGLAKPAEFEALVASLL